MLPREEPLPLPPNVILDSLEQYFKILVSIEKVHTSDSFWQFIELSDFNHEGIVKVKETYVKKWSGGHFQTRNCFASCFNPFSPWKKRYIVITSEGIMYAIGKQLTRTLLLQQHQQFIHQVTTNTRRK